MPGDSTQLPLTTWTHIAATYDGATLRLFVNGTQVGTRAVSGSIVISGNPLRIGGNSIWGEYFSGRVDDVRIYNRAISTAQIQTDMNMPVAPPAPDATAPTVAINSPAAGSTLSATVTVTASASDNVAVSGVQFMLDDLPLGAEDTSSPYAISWNTATASNAAHRVSARARDAAGNIGVAADVAVTVSNPPKLIITAPAPGVAISGSTVGVAYTTQGDLTGVDHAHFRLDTKPEVMDLTLDGAYTIPEVAQGSHVLNGYLVRSDHSKISGTDAAPVSFSTLTPDTAPPSVSITAPSNWSAVSGTVTVIADANDDVGVTAVQFLIDGSNWGPPDTGPPYAASWQSSSVANGPHTLSAVAYDASSNQASTTVTVTVSNTDPAAITGRWTSAMNWPLVAVHATLLHTGEVLLWDGWELPAAAAKVWNPATNGFTSAPAQSGLFCAAHSQLSDGRILVVGGHAGGEVGIRDVNLFDPRTRVWTHRADMSVARWYPSGTTLGDGRVLAVSGQINPGVWADTPEIYDPDTNVWTSLTQISNADLHDSEYPLSFLLPDGRVSVVSAMLGKVRLLDLDRLTSADAGYEPRLLKSTVAMYRPGRLLATGGGNSAFTSSAQTTASVIDFGQTSPAWRAVAPMAYPRYNHNLVVLADGSVLAVGGSTDLSLTSSTGTLAPEIWDPATETWRTMASMRDRRNYHSTALLLPDGRVLVAGGGRLSPATDFLTAEIFSPPYLFKGTRPTIASAPALMPQTGTVIVETPQALDIASVAMIRPGSVTHTLDMDQRYLPLSFSAEAGRLLVSGPGNSSLAPPGYYMLVIVDRQGIPSTASFVRVPSPREDAEPPGAPSSLAASGGVGVANLTLAGRQRQPGGRGVQRPPLDPAGVYAIGRESRRPRRRPELHGFGNCGPLFLQGHRGGCGRQRGPAVERGAGGHCRRYRSTLGDPDAAVEWLDGLRPDHDRGRRIGRCRGHRRCSSCSMAPCSGRRTRPRRTPSSGAPRARRTDRTRCRRGRVMRAATRQRRPRSPSPSPTPRLRVWSRRSGSTKARAPRCSIRPAPTTTARSRARPGRPQGNSAGPSRSTVRRAG